MRPITPEQNFPFDVLARFNPSCIVEFTATPDTKENPSNVLYRASAAELKSDNMIKIPIRLETRTDWRELLADAVKTRDSLEKYAEQEQQQTGEYLRPIMLLQAQRKSQTQDTLTHEVIKESLIRDFHIPAEQIATETGNVRDLEDVDLADSDCSIRYVITVDALREGWDCPFAYVLYTVSESYSSRAVEQILGRILRLPQAEPKQNELLNIAYAYATSPNWPQVAMNLRDALIGNGFNPLEAKDLVTLQETQGELFEDQDEAGLPLWASTICVTVDEVPDIEALSDDLKKIVSFDEKEKKITFKADITEKIRNKFKKQLKGKAMKAAIDEAYEKSLARQISARNKLRKQYRFSIPVLGFRDGDLFEPFEKTHLLECEWSLAKRDYKLTEAEYSGQWQQGTLGEIGLDETGDLIADQFIDKLANDVLLFDSDTNWTDTELAKWLDDNIKHPDIPKK